MNQEGEKRTYEELVEEFHRLNDNKSGGRVPEGSLRAAFLLTRARDLLKEREVDGEYRGARGWLEGMVSNLVGSSGSENDQYIQDREIELSGDQIDAVLSVIHDEQLAPFRARLEAARAANEKVPPAFLETDWAE